MAEFSLCGHVVFDLAARILLNADGDLLAFFFGEENVKVVRTGIEDPLACVAIAYVFRPETSSSSGMLHFQLWRSGELGWKTFGGGSTMEFMVSRLIMLSALHGMTQAEYHAMMEVYSEQSKKTKAQNQEAF